MKSFIRPIDWLGLSSHGYGNGYVVLPVGHKFTGVHYDDIPVSVHGGLTFSKEASALTKWEQISADDAGGWVIGFDTCHYGDDAENCSKSFVMEEIERLLKQL